MKKTKLNKLALLVPMTLLFSIAAAWAEAPTVENFLVEERPAALLAQEPPIICNDRVLVKQDEKITIGDSGDCGNPSLSDLVLKTPVIPPSLPIIKSLVDSTEEKTEYLFRKKPTDKPSKVVGIKTTYDYLLEGGGHLKLDRKIEKVRDIRVEAKRHPILHRELVRIRQTSKFWFPILQAGGAVAQILWLVF